jgi:hypothetical protein
MLLIRSPILDFCVDMETHEETESFGGATSVIKPFEVAIFITGLFVASSASYPFENPTGATAECRGIARQVEPLPELVADRPDFTDSAILTRPGVVQVEIGTTLDREGSAVSQGELLVRTGLSRRVELRFGGQLSEDKTPGGFRRGASNMESGIKVRLWEQRGRLPAVALIATLSKLSGDSDTPYAAYEPTVKLAWSKDLIKGFTLGSNFNMSSIRVGSGRVVQNAQSASVGHELPVGFEGYWEVFHVSPWDDGKGTAWVANTGVSHGIGHHAQLDLRIGKRLTAEGPNWFLGVGFTFRQPVRFLMR